MDKNSPLKTIWLGIMLGLLLVSAPQWLTTKHTSNYDAPWIYPGDLPGGGEQ